MPFHQRVVCAVTAVDPSLVAGFTPAVPHGHGPEPAWRVPVLVAAVVGAVAVTGAVAIFMAYKFGCVHQLHEIAALENADEC